MKHLVAVKTRTKHLLLFNQVYIKLYLSSAENINEQEPFLNLLKMIDNPSRYILKFLNYAMYF